MAEFLCKTEAPDDEARTFIDLVKLGDSSRLETFLEKTPSIRKHLDEPWFEFDAPAIVYAVSRGQREIADVLLDTGANINAKSDWDAGPWGVLHHFAFRWPWTPSHDEQQSFARHLIDRGAYVDAHAAAGLSMLDQLKVLVTENPNCVHERGGDGAFPLHFAATVEIADFLLEHGANIDARDVDHGSTAAQWLIKEHPEVTRFLIERGTTLDIFMGCALGDLELVKCSIHEDPDCVHARIGEGVFSAPPDGADTYKWQLGFDLTPAQVAFDRGYSDIYKLIFDQLRHNDQFLTACWVADASTAKRIQREHPSIVDDLTPDERGQIALAAWYHRTDAVRLMLDLGFEIDTRGIDDGTPLDRASVRGYVDLVELCLEQNASVEVRNTYGGTPLDAALWGTIYFKDPEGDYPAVVRSLLEAGVPISSPGPEGLTDSLGWQVNEGPPEIVKLLVEFGADPTRKNEQGDSAFELAKRRGDDAIIDALN